MVRGGKKEEVVPEMEERARRKKLAFSRGMLSQNPAKLAVPNALKPSKTVTKHNGKDILRKSQRKSRYLFSFPGLFSPISGGKIGDLKDLGTKNPLLYLDFPGGRLKLFGTIVYPKNRYLTLQFSKGGKNVTCDDYFDNMIVFSDAWWIGTQDENPEELQLPFPKELNLGENTEYDFKGGVGVTSEIKQGNGKSAMECLEIESPKVDDEDDLTDSPIDLKESVEVTPSRQSARTAGKTFNFVESSGDDIIGNGTETSEEEDEKVGIRARRKHTFKTSVVTENSCPVISDIDDGNDLSRDSTLKQNKPTSKAKELSSTGCLPLVQTTISSLFKKEEDKRWTNKSPVVQVLSSDSSDQGDSCQDAESSDKDWTS